MKKSPVESFRLPFATRKQCWGTWTPIWTSYHEKARTKPRQGTNLAQAFPHLRRNDTIEERCVEILLCLHIVCPLQFQACIMSFGQGKSRLQGIYSLLATIRRLWNGSRMLFWKFCDTRDRFQIHHFRYLCRAGGLSDVSEKLQDEKYLCHLHCMRKFRVGDIHRLGIWKMSQVDMPCLLPGWIKTSGSRVCSAKEVSHVGLANQRLYNSNKSMHVTCSFSHCKHRHFWGPILLRPDYGRYLPFCIRVFILTVSWSG